MTNAEFQKLKSFAAHLVRQLADARSSGNETLVAELRRKVKWTMDAIAMAQFKLSASQGLASPSRAGIGCSECTVSALASLAGDLRGAL